MRVWERACQTLSLGLIRNSAFIVVRSITTGDSLCARRSDNALSFQYPPDFFKYCRDIALRKPYLPEAMNVCELRATVLKKNDRLFETKPPLKKSGFVNDILPRMKCLVAMHVF